MPAADIYRALAEKFLHTDKYEEIVIPDSLLKLLPHMYTEEEAELVLQLGGAMQTAGAIAKKVNRPVEEVQPLLKSLGERILILGISGKGAGLYGLLPIYPIIYDSQMLRSDRKMKEGDDGAWFKEFTRLFNDFLDEFYEWLGSNEVGEKYQILGIPFGRIITVEESIEATPGLGIVAFPSDRFSELVDRAKKSLSLINVCACRQGMTLLGKGCGRLENTCSAMGLPAEGAIKSGMGRRVSKEEFLEAKLQATQSGLVHMTENVLDPILVCSCCDCCCEILRMLQKYNSPATLTQSHFEAVISQKKSKGCKTCSKICPMNAITVKNKKATIDYNRCIGCGVCVIKCDKQHAIVLRTRKVHKPPADTMAEFWVRHYFEQKGQEQNLVPRLTLGVTRLLGKVNPIHVTGPRAISFKD